MMISFFRFIDKYLIWFFLLIFFRLKHIPFVNKNKIKQSPKKILVIRLWALWSSLLTFPMIKQLKDHYWDNIQYDLLASTRNIWVFKNQWYFQNMFNLFSLKDLLKLVISFKKYDIVIDAEEYFRVSSFVSLWTWKLTVGYGNIFIRKLVYNHHHIYSEKMHNLVNCLSLLKPLWIKIHIPNSMEPLVYKQKDAVKVDAFLSVYTWTFVCMHTWWAETAKERSRPQKKWIQLIISLCEKYPTVYIFLSGTNFEKDIVQNILHELPQKYHSQVLNICWKFNLFEFAYLLEKCSLMISNDTWPMHLAAAMRTKTIGLFGPELPRKFGPWPLNKNVWLYKWKWKAFINVHLAQRKKDKEYVIDKISVEDVMKELKELK